MNIVVIQTVLMVKAGGGGGVEGEGGAKCFQNKQGKETLR